MTLRRLRALLPPAPSGGALLCAAALFFALAASSPAPVRAADPQLQSQMQNARRALTRGQFQQAAEAYRKILGARPLDGAAAAGLAEALVGLKKVAEADSVIAAALGKVSAPADLYQLRARIRRSQDRPVEAFQDVVSLLDADIERAPWAFRETRDMLNGGLDAARAVDLADAARRAHPGSVPFAVLTALIHGLDGRAEEGLRLLLADEESQKLRGKALLLYADHMLALGHEGAGVSALESAADRLDDPAQRSVVLFRVAEVHETQGRYAAALAALERITAERPGTGAAGKALLASADIHQRYLKDPGSALAVYRRIQDDPMLGHRRPEMLLQMADCYVRLGDLDEGARTYASVIPEAVDPEHAETAAYKLAEVEFFRGNIDSALVLYQDMAQAHPRSLLADDAAGRYILLNKYLLVGGGTAAQLLGRMAWGVLVGDSAAVDSSATLLIENWGEGELAAEAYLGLADLAERSGRYPDAIDYLERLVAGHADDPRAPLALRRQGDILVQHLSRPRDALIRYETILTDYPNSVQAGEARRLVETLRRDLKS